MSGCVCFFAFVRCVCFCMENLFLQFFIALMLNNINFNCISIVNFLSTSVNAINSFKVTLVNSDNLSGEFI